MSKKIVCIVGATASGKTSLAVEVAKLLDSEVVSADSMQVYKHLNIGSAKPTQDEMCGIVHHLIDCIEIDAPKYSVSDYAHLAKEKLNDIISRGKLPIVAGGTGLYINAITFPLSFAGVKADDKIRAELNETEKNAPGSLYNMLCEIDPITAKRLHKNDTKRLVRAIEVYKLSGKPLSQHGNNFKEGEKAECEFSPVMFGITMPRELLYMRIEHRVDIMMQNGLLQEVKDIMSLSSFNKDLPAMQGLGYKQIIEHILYNKPETIEETVEKIKLETRHFAKRQLTWFRRDERINWIDITQFESVKCAAQKVVEIIRSGSND